MPTPNRRSRRRRPKPYQRRALAQRCDGFPAIMASPNARRRQTAIHEAGHAVIGRVLAMSCKGATIQPDHDSAWHAILEGPYTTVAEWERRGHYRDPQVVYIGRILTFMAGAEAVRMLLGVLDDLGDHDDLTQVWYMLEDMPRAPADLGRYELRLRQMACMLVRRHRERIERVADELERRTTLSRSHLDRLVGRSIADVRMNAPFLALMANAADDN
jgi:hypothetical protein